MSRSSASAPPTLISAREALALNMIRLRAERGWSQEDLAHEAGLHRTFIGHVERQARNISLDNVERIAHVFGLQAHQLLAPVARPRNPGS
ncbi:MAG: helix-turn-helix transcriptional regulator [Hydrogenophaga sp.]|jgi:transcriptional regulator with XRE-family HTH domain|uniref:helix-turn-helix transcriptional regulator n=2 Tax=unclassified Hydrogenophaga TaxID=2610897 RepID=UPI0036D322A8